MKATREKLNTTMMRFSIKATAVWFLIQRAMEVLMRTTVQSLIQETQRATTKFRTNKTTTQLFFQEAIVATMKFRTNKQFLFLKSSVNKQFLVEAIVAMMKFNNKATEQFPYKKVVVAMAAMAKKKTLPQFL